ncbi:MAG: GxxExxY protein [Bacteroidota bacterium]
MPKNLIYKTDAYFVIGPGLNVHNELGKGFNAAVYSDALEIEVKENGIPNKRQAKYEFQYKGKKLPRYDFADFVLDDTFIPELKAIESLTKNYTIQALNYLAASKIKLGLLVNFGEDSIVYKEIML